MTSYLALIDSLRPAKSVVSLPVDDSLRNFPRRIVGAVFASVPVQSLLKPLRVVAVSVPALSQLLPGFQASADIPENFAQIFSGSKLPPNVPFLASHCYWGTQFGNYAGQLGDGTATLIGQSQTGYEVNLKGTGQTPFSRGFDGRKVLRSSVREFLCSEAMAGLGIPTTRAAALVVSEASQVMRDVNYSGSPIMEKCAVVSRTAKTFIRFGSFESRDIADSPTIRKLAGYCWHELLKQNNDREDFMSSVIDKTARTVALWQSVGFVHGVLNTDNMSIIGDTIDYGPFGFIENYDPHFIPNTSDKFGRYAFSEQGKIAAWNLTKLYESLKLHIIGDSDADLSDEQERDLYEKFGFRMRLSDDEIGQEFDRKFQSHYNENMRKKLGLKSDVDEDQFGRLLATLNQLMEDSAVDFTYTFRMLSEMGSKDEIEIVDAIMSTVPSTDRVGAFSSSVVRISKTDLPEIEEFAKTRMVELNRVGIDDSTIERWKFHLNRIENFGYCDNYSAMVNGFRERWAQFVSELEKLTDKESRYVMKKVNPVYVPRQNLLQKAIEECENGNDEEVKFLLELFLNPYVVNTRVDHDKYAKPDLNFYGSRLSCSS